MKNKIKFGLRPTKQDNRDFKLSSIVRLPKLDELPEEFILKPLSIKYQGSSDFCTSMATCGVSELQEGVELSPEWSFAVSKMISGDLNGWGQDLRSAMKAHTRYGAINQAITSLTLEELDHSVLRDIKSYPDYLFSKATKHRKKSYVSVDGQYDPFDNIRASIWKFREEKRAVITGLLWKWDMKEPIITNVVNDSGEGHCIWICGWKKVNGQPMLVLVNSYGKWSGDNGLFYVPRAVVNHAVRKFGSYTFIDMTPEELQKLNWSRIQIILGKLKEALQKLLNLLKLQKSDY